MCILPIVFSTSRSEMDWVVSRCGMNIDSVMDEGCIRMRGLPYGCTKEEVASFFSGMKSNFSIFITFFVCK